MKAKKLVAILLCLVMAVSLFAACGEKKNKNDTGNQNNNQQNQDNTGNNDADNSTGGDTDTGNALTELPLPLTAEKENLSVWTFYANDFLDGPGDVKGVQKMEEVTNVHIEWQTVLSAEAQEKMGLLLASGNFPDIIYFALATPTRQYTGGMEKGIADVVLIDATPLIENYMPNYKRLMEAQDESRIESMTDTGLKTIWSYSANDQGPHGENEWCGMVIRKDWLDELNMPMPETLDDWHDTLVAFKEQKGADAPLMIGTTGPVGNGAFLTAFGILPAYYQVNGEVKYGPAQPEYKEYIDLMAQWYKEGLIDPNFMTNNAGIGAPNEYIVNGRAGAFSTFYSMANQGMINMGLVTDNPNFYLQAVKNPVKNQGDTPYTSKVADGIVNSMIGITTGCKNPELAAMWLDFNYTTEGMLMNMYGVEGESFTVAEDGSYQFTDEILNNPDYSPTDALKFWARGNGLGLYNWETAMRTYSNYDEIIETEKVWTEQDISLCLPKNLFMTDEEANKYSSLYTSIETMVQENTCNWIQGAMTTDNFDEFVDSLYQFGLQECIDIQQGLLDRYNARK